MISAAVWTLSDGMDLVATSLESHLFWAKFSYLGAGTVSVFLLLMALDYTGRGRLVTTPRITGLLSVPILGFVAVCLNRYHGLTWSGITESPADPRVLVYHHGPLFWILLTYAFALLVVTTSMLVRFAYKAPAEYRRQSFTIMVSMLVPWLAMALYVAFPGGLPGFNPSIALVVSGSILVSGLLGRRLLQLVPIAREALIETMSDGLVAVDTMGNAILLNPAGIRLLDLQIDTPGTRPLGELLGHWPDLVSRIEQTPETEEHFVLESGLSHIEFELLPLRDNRGTHQGYLVVARDITQRVSAEAALTRTNRELEDRLVEIENLHAELSEQAIRDPLTGLLNRRYLNEMLAGELGRAAREGYPVSFIMLDIDGFKHVNDLLGHATGDLILKLLGSQLLSQTRPGDITCRYGGDEFLVILTNTDLASAGRRAQQWRTDFEAASGEVMGLDEPVSISVGVATYPLHGESAEQVFAAADAAMYSAKAAGRNRVIVSAL